MRGWPARTPHSAEALGYGAGPGPPSQCGGAAGTAGWDFRRSREQPQPAQLIRLPAPVTCCIPEGGEGGGGGGVNKGGEERTGSLTYFAPEPWLPETFRLRGLFLLFRAGSGPRYRAAVSSPPPSPPFPES